MSQSPTIGKLAASLIKVQAEMKPVPRNAENPFFQSGYADLAACINHASPLLTKNGLAIIQTSIPSTDGKLTMKTSLVHESGEWIDGEMAVTPTKQDPQGAGSAVTYMRRYGYCAIIGLAQEGEDDDGNRATHGKLSERSQAPNGHSEPSQPQKPAKSSAGAGKQASSASLQRADVTLDSVKPWTSRKGEKFHFCKFITDSGAELEASTKDPDMSAFLCESIGGALEITYRPGFKEGTWELCTAAPADNFP